MNDDLLQIKKEYGEKMMQLCRRNFATILETPGLLYSILSSHIAPTHSLADDIINHYREEDFVNYIYSMVQKDEEEEELPDTGKNPFELMREAGYRLFKCSNEGEIQSFKHYYRPGEELCTFNGGRLQRCIVFFAVKDNANELKREDFIEPQREDEYGTSVISIQFGYGEFNELSIKNRYNHTVNNPDATFNNNLENIIPGLTRSFEKAYNLKVVSGPKNYNFLTEDLRYIPAYIPKKDENGNIIEPKDIKDIDRKLYRYNVEIDGIYFCEGNLIVRDGVVIDDYKKDAGRYIIADNYVIDAHEKTIYPFEYKEKKKENEEEKKVEIEKLPRDDSFTNSIKEVGEIKNITVLKDNGNRVIKIKYIDGKEVFITVDKTNSIVGYKNEYIKKLEKGFLKFNVKLRELSVDNVEVVERDCLVRNAGIRVLSLPKAEYLGDYFLCSNRGFNKLYIPKVREMGTNVFEYNNALEKFEAPSLVKMGSRVLSNNHCLHELSLDNLKYMGSFFARENRNVWDFIHLPKVLIIGSECFSNIMGVKRVNFNSVEIMGPDVLASETYLRELVLPNVVEIYSGFMNSNQYLEYFYAPNLKKVQKHIFENKYGMESEILYYIDHNKPCEIYRQEKMM